MIKAGDIVDRDGSKYLVTNVYTLCGTTAYDSVLAPDKKSRGAAKAAGTSDSTPTVDQGADETPEE